MDLATRISLITPRSFEQIDKYSNIQMIKIQKYEYNLLLITPRSFDPSKPRELQLQLGKRWEVIGQDFAIERVNNQTPPASAPASTPPPTPPASKSEEFGTNSGSRQIVKIVCMSDTHSTQGEFG